MRILSCLYGMDNRFIFGLKYISGHLKSEYHYPSSLRYRRCPDDNACAEGPEVTMQGLQDNLSEHVPQHL